EMGLAHADYQLYDAQSNLVQNLTESSEGVFGIYKIIDTYTSKRSVDAWISTEKESVYFSEPARLTFHLRNNTQEPQTLDLKYAWNHGDTHYFNTVTIPPKERLDLEFNIETPPLAHFYSYYWGGTVGLRFRLFYGSSQTNQFSQATKGIRFKTSKTSSSIQFQPVNVKVGDPFSYGIEVENQSEIAIGETAVSVSLEKLEWPGNTYTAIKTIYETTHELGQGETFNYNGSYTPEPGSVHEAGMYRLKLGVTKADGSLEQHYYHFFYLASNVWARVLPLSDRTLKVGTSY
ncbi:MAG: hypothetical protein GY940_12530, partial [bacterium]|nr:hypothetical protein [bacterium]